MTDAELARDEWLARRCQAKEAGALSDLVRHFERPLFYFASKTTGSEDVAQDVMQEVWVHVSRRIGALREPSRVRAWLYRTTHGIAVDRIRMDRRRLHLESEHVTATDATEDFELGAICAMDIHRELDRLPPDQREVLTLFFLEDFSIAEIAGILGKPEGTVKSRLYHAKRALKEQIGKGLNHV